MRTALYRHFDAAGDLLYVGISANPFARMGVHKCLSDWFAGVAAVKVEWFDTKAQAEQAETEAIRSERPIHNRIAASYGRPPGPQGPRKILSGPLPEWLRANGVSQACFARIIGVSDSRVSQLVRRKKVPSVEIAIAIERATGGAVPASSWLSE